MIGKVIRWNWDDFVLVAAVPGGLFVVLELVVGIILLTVRPDTTVAMGGIMLPMAGGIFALIASVSTPTVLFDLIVKSSVTRKRALVGTVSMMLLLTAETMLLGWLLGQADVLIARAWVDRLPWLEAVEFEGVLPLWIWALAAVGITLFGLGGGAALQRFGLKAFWVLWGAWMVLMLLSSQIDWDALFGMMATLPLLAAAAVGMGGWGCWSLLRSSVRA